MSIYDAENNTLTDLRDNQVYKTVTIGERIWMAENLNYATIVISSDSTSFCYADNGMTERGRENCSIFGRLYTWNAALDACPMGWHLPTKDEWETLFTEAGEKSFAGRALKSQSGWCNNGNGTDAFGFSALPAGLRNNEGDFDFGVNYGGEMAYFWSSTEDSYSGAYHISFNFESDKVNITAVTDDDDFFLGPDERLNHNERLKKYAFSVRCIKDN
ncbi:MAG: fibrobacter succinogenes major paralogous domain-containing protein [Fibrobacter sp.]|nr:fibrobacter succinogenes major paralogous domain-containing protein [Fibrobacter sp.]